MNGRKRVLTILGIAASVSLFGASAQAGHGTVIDILSFRNVFFPDQPKVCPQLATALDEVTERAANEGYPIKVAIIGSEADIGGASQYFGRPQDYARLLGSQIGFYHPGVPGVQTNDSLLVAMPDGFGFVRSGKAANVSLVIFGLKPPKGKHPNDLSRAAIGAVRELADAAGHPVPAPKVGECDGDGSSVIVYVVPIVLIALAATAVVLVTRRRRA
jgi:hypothetical protein